MQSDSPIVDEVRKRRSEISEQFGDDVDRYGEHLRKLQEQFRHRLVSQITVIPSQSGDSLHPSEGDRGKK